MISGLEILRYTKSVAAALGVTGVVYSAYTVSGLPVPATVHQVDIRIETVTKSIQIVSAEVLETQRAVLALRKNVLRSEKYTLSRALSEAKDNSDKIALTRRLGEIDDEISDIEKKDSGLTAKLQSLRTAAR